jgi:hypothetical protein
MVCAIHTHDSNVVSGTCFVTTKVLPRAKNGVTAARRHNRE